MLKKLLIILLLSFSTMGFSAESTKVNNKTKIEFRNRKIRPLALIGEIDAYYLNLSHELYISFPDSEGWADLVITTISGELVFKDRFHSGFEYCKYIGVPDMPWKIEVNTTQGGAYEGWLILQE